MANEPLNLYRPAFLVRIEGTDETVDNYSHKEFYWTNNLLLVSGNELDLVSGPPLTYNGVV